MRILHITLCLGIGLFLSGCVNPTGQTAASDHMPIKFSTSYEIPDFAEIERIEKIRSTLSHSEMFFSDVARQNHVPGIVYGVVVGDTLIYSGGTGFINLSTQSIATPTSLFRIASMTKSFTAMAILKLRDEGKLSLGDPVLKYIPELKQLTYLTEDAAPITIFNLLTMTAGFPEDNPWGDRYLDMTDEAFMVQLEEGISFSSVPSQHYEYSNLGYGLLGNIITRLTGESFQKFITKSILEPLGMTHTYWEFTDVPDSLLALGYRWEETQWKNEPLLHDGAFGAMGGLITSIEDFSKYVSFHLSAWPARNGPEKGPVSRSTVREMQRMNYPELDTDTRRFGDYENPVIFGYGYGLRVLKGHEDMLEVGHNGGLPGFGSSYVFYPHYGIGIMAFANRTYSGGAVKQGVYQLAQLLIKEGHFRPRTLAVSDILARRKDQVIQLIKFRDPSLEAEILAKNFYMDKSREVRKEESDKAIAFIGEIVTVGEMIPENQLRGSFMIHGTRGSVEVYFTLTPESSPKVQWLSFHYK